MSCVFVRSTFEKASQRLMTILETLRPTIAYYPMVPVTQGFIRFGGEGDSMERYRQHLIAFIFVAVIFAAGPSLLCPTGSIQHGSRTRTEFSDELRKHTMVSKFLGALSKFPTSLSRR